MPFSLKKYCVVLAAFAALAAYCDLPSNLVQANWVESKGGYIKTGVTQSGATLVELECVLELTELDYGKRRLMGFDGSGPKNYFGVNATNHFDIWHASKIEAEANVKYRLYLTQTKTTTTLYVYDHASGDLLETLSGNSKGINSSECQVFTINSSANYLCYGMRVYNFKVSIDGDLKRDLVPVFDVSQSKAGMYDSVSETTFYAYGSGKIVCDAFRFQYGSGDTKIVCDEGCMYFPAHVSFSDLSELRLDSGTTLSGTVEGRSLAFGTDTLDMHEIFGEMEPGVKYDLKIDYPSGFRTNFFIAKSANIAALYVTLDDHDIAYINRSKKNEAAGAALKIKPDGTSSGLLQVKKIAGRGNATWTYSGDKKPYKINLNEKYALIEGVAKSKKFALLSLNLQDRKDRSGLKEWIAHELADAMGMNFNPGMEFVDLYINSSYRGFYLLKERVTIDSKRININKPNFTFEDEESTTRVVQRNGIKGVGGASGDLDDIAPYNVSSWNIPSPTETVNVEDDSTDPALAAGIQAYQYATNSRIASGSEGGLVIEMNVCYGVYCQDEISFIITRRGQIYTLKEPEACTKEQIQRIGVFVQEYEDALFDPQGFNSKGKHYSDYIDVASMAKHLMLDGFLCNSDFCILSTFFYIDADPVSGEFTGKLIAEPVWDYDFSQISSSHLYTNNSSPAFLIPQFLKKADFVKALYEQQTAAPGFSTRLAELNSGETAQKGELLSAAHHLNYLRWGSDSLSDVETIKSHMVSRRTSWNNIWNDNNKLFGAWIEERKTRSLSEYLDVQTYGTPISQQWYKKDSETGDLEELEGETTSSIDPQIYGKGEYVCEVYGKNLESQAGGTYITLTTSPFAFGVPEPGLMTTLLAAILFLRKK